MNILLCYHHSGWRKAGYAFEKYFAAAGHFVDSIAIERTPYWTDWSGRLPLYAPKGWPVTVAALSERFGREYDLVMELDGTGQYHVSGRAPGRRALWSCDIYRSDKRKFHAWMEEDFDLVFTAQKDFTGFFKKRKALWSPYACDPDVYAAPPLPKVYDIAFVGNADPAVYPERARLLEALKRRFNVSVVQGAFAGELAKVYAQSKIVFNKSHSGELNMRVFETLSCGALLLTDRLKPESGLDDLFADGRHLACYDGEKDLVEKAAHFLSHAEERERIAAEGQKEVRAKHTYAHRAQAMIQALAPVLQAD